MVLLWSTIRGTARQAWGVMNTHLEAFGFRPSQEGISYAWLKT